MTANVSGLNPSGAITGNYFDASGVLHGYVREADGTFTTWEAPGAGTGAGQGTLGASINVSGIIAGEYLDASNAFHGYLRARDGTFTTFEAPSAGTGASSSTSRERQPIEHDHGTVS